VPSSRPAGRAATTSPWSAAVASIAAWAQPASRPPREVIASGDSVPCRGQEQFPDPSRSWPTAASTPPGRGGMSSRPAAPAATMWRRSPPSPPRRDSLGDLGVEVEQRPEPVLTPIHRGREVGALRQMPPHLLEGTRVLVLERDALPDVGEDPRRHHGRRDRRPERRPIACCETYTATSCPRACWVPAKTGRASRWNRATSLLCQDPRPSHSRVIVVSMRPMRFARIAAYCPPVTTATVAGAAGVTVGCVTGR
jgi:hypothetical protein